MTCPACGSSIRYPQEDQWGFYHCHNCGFAWRRPNAYDWDEGR